MVIAFLSFDTIILGYNKLLRYTNGRLKMDNLKILKDKKILIVDDEPDVLETMIELLDMCRIDTAPDFEAAEKLLIENSYDMAILDIMGVRGYDLLEIANQRETPTLMLTAHALNPDAFVKSMESGAMAYIPKEKMTEIATYVADLLKAQQAGIQRPGGWFESLRSFFEKAFGHDWLDQYKKAQKKYPWLDFDD